ncbi:MAG: ABC transporter permease, partial [Coriobacteriales bacterium]|nr:ABC transporter permease [Coriobacteriales bacterium]
MRMSFTLAWRYLRGRPSRAVLTTLAIVLGVALVFGLNGVLPAAIQAFQRNLLATTGRVDVTVSNADAAFFDPSVADRVASVAGIADATPVVRRTLALPRGGPVNSVTVVGVEPSSMQRIRSFPMSEGRFITPSDSGTIAVSQGLAERAGLRVGSTFSLPGAGGTRDLTVVGIIGIPSAPGAEEVFVPLADAEQLFATTGEINEVDASLESGADRNRVEAAVRRRLGEDYTTAGIDTTSQLFASIRVSQYTFTMFGVFALVMAGFIILNTFRTVVAERRHDIGMLRAVGAPGRIILGMFLVEAVIQGTVGVSLGLLLGWGIAAGMLQVMAPVYAQLGVNVTLSGPIFTPSTWALAIVLGLATTLFGALQPALSAARIQPMEALRPHIEGAAEQHRHVVPWIGVGVVALSLVGLFSRQIGAVGAGSVGVLVGLVMMAPLAIGPVSRVVASGIQIFLPAEGELARSNTVRQPGRAAVTASAVMLSLAIIVGLLGIIASLYAGFFNYLDKSLTSADYVVLPAGLILTGSLGADQAFVNSVEDIPGVGDVATLRVARATYDGAAIQVVGIDPKTYTKVASFEFIGGGTNADVTSLSEPRTTIANGVFAGQSGVQPGD